MFGRMESQAARTTMQVGRIAVASIVLPMVWYALSTAINWDHEGNLSTLLWMNQTGNGLRAATNVLLVGCLWYVAARQSKVTARTLLFMAGTLFVAVLLIRLGVAVWVQREGSSVAAWQLSSQITASLRLAAILALAVVAWHSARIASIVALGVEVFFWSDVMWKVLPASYYTRSTAPLVFLALAVVLAVANVVQLKAIAADTRCDSKPLLRSSYDQLSVSMALRVVVAVVACLFVLMAFGSNGRQLKWLLPVSVTGAWLANVWGGIGATRLVFADTGNSGRVAIGAGALIWAVVVQLPLVVMLWNVAQGRTDHFDSESLTNFQYAAPIVTVFGLLVLVTAVRNAAARDGQFALAESTMASAIIIGILSVAALAAQYGMTRIKTKSEALLALALAAGCGLFAVIMLMGVFSRARDAQDQTPQPLPSARIV